MACSRASSAKAVRITTRVGTRSAGQPFEHPCRVVIRERQVEDEHVRAVPLDRGEGGERGGGASDDVHVAFEAEDLLEAVEHDRVIVGEHEARHAEAPR